MDDPNDDERNLLRHYAEREHVIRGFDRTAARNDPQYASQRSRLVNRRTAGRRFRSPRSVVREAPQIFFSCQWAHFTST